MDGSDFPGSSEAGMLTELAHAFTALVRCFTSSGGPLAVDTVAGSLRDLFPAAEHVDLVDRRDGRLRAHTAGDEVGRQILRIVEETADGPILDILEVNDVVVCNDIATDRRWPAWAQRVHAETPAASALSFRLFLSPDACAALTFYSEWPHAFGDAEVALGSILASYCSLVLLSEVLVGRPVSPARARDVHQEIGVAMALLFGHHQDTPVVLTGLHRAARTMGDTIASLP